MYAVFVFINISGMRKTLTGLIKVTKAHKPMPTKLFSREYLKQVRLL